MSDTVKDIPVALTTDEVIEIDGGTESKEPWPQNEKHTFKYYLKQATWLLGVGHEGEMTVEGYFRLPVSEQRFLFNADSGYFEQTGRILPKGTKVEIEFTNTGASANMTVYSSIVVRRY